MKSLQNKIVLQPDVSSIKSHNTDPNQENSQEDIELEQVNFSLMNQYEFYYGLDTKNLTQTQLDGEQYIVDSIKRILQQVYKTAQENEIQRKIPIMGIQTVYEFIQYPINTYFQQAEDPTKDAQCGGLNEDEEPVSISREQWLCALIGVKQQQALTQEGDHSTTQRQSQTTFMKSKVFQDQAPPPNQKKQHLDPQPIDLTEPIDISFTEEQMRGEKERQMKEKMELREAENRRRMKEQKEEQLKYEMMAKDKKSKQFTYDYDGKLIPVNYIKSHKFQPSTITINSQFIEDQNKLQKPKRMIPAPLTTKKGKDDEKDNIKFQQLAPNVVDNMQLQTGVNIIVEGRVREGPRPQTVDFDNLTNANSRMARNEYLGLAQIQNVSRSGIPSTMAPKAEEKPLRDIDSKVMNLERIKRLSGNQNSVLGSIKVNSTKIAEILVNTIYEQDELAIPPPPKQKMKELQSPIDTFNISLYKNQNVNKDPISQTHDKLKVKKARERHCWIVRCNEESKGKRNKRNKRDNKT
ncbi:hypothetical protein pb186bvf_016582 [Paramecium bursaria]